MIEFETYCAERVVFRYPPRRYNRRISFWGLFEITLYALIIAIAVVAFISAIYSGNTPDYVAAAALLVVLLALQWHKVRFQKIVFDNTTKQIHWES